MTNELTAKQQERIDHAWDQVQIRAAQALSDASCHTLEDALVIIKELEKNGWTILQSPLLTILRTNTPRTEIRADREPAPTVTVRVK
jgi:hypothetical protein